MIEPTTYPLRPSADEDVSHEQVGQIEAPQLILTHMFVSIDRVYGSLKDMKISRGGILAVKKKIWLYAIVARQDPLTSYSDFYIRNAK